MWQQKTEFKYVDEYPIQKELDGTLEFSEGISSYTEFDPLILTALGTLDGTSKMGNIFLEYERQHLQDMSLDKFPDKIVDTVQKESTDIAKELLKRGIKVVRPAYLNHEEEFDTIALKTSGYNSFNPRDLLFAYDDCLYEFPCHAHCRDRQKKIYQWIEKQLAANGSKIYRAPKLEFDYILMADPKTYEMYKTDMVFGDAANLIKLGLDILFLNSRSGSWGCYKKFRQLLQEKYDKKVRLHPMVDLYEEIHVDTTISVVGYNKKLDKNLVVVDSKYVTPHTIPAIFRGKNWAVIEIEKVVDQKADYPERFLTSDKIGINFVALGPSLIMMNKLQTELIKTFDFYGVQTVPMAHTYARHIGGGFHCMTNDFAREDTYGFKKTLQTPRAQLPKQKLAGLFDPQLLELLEGKGDIVDWVKICNENEIYPTYLTEHMSPQELESMEARQKVAKAKHQK